MAPNIVKCNSAVVRWCNVKYSWRQDKRRVSHGVTIQIPVCWEPVIKWTACSNNVL